MFPITTLGTDELQTVFRTFTIWAPNFVARLTPMVH